MGVKLTKVPKLNPEDLTERETLLWQIIRELREKVGELTDEIARLKGEKEKPKIKPSLLEPKDKNSSPQEDEASETSGEKTSDSQEKKKRPGSAKRKKTLELTIHENKVIPPLQEIPPGSEFKGYQDYTVQELLIKPHNIRYRLARWKTPTAIAHILAMNGLHGLKPHPVRIGLTFWNCWEETELITSSLMKP